MSGIEWKGPTEPDMAEVGDDWDSMDGLHWRKFEDGWRLIAAPTKREHPPSTEREFRYPAFPFEAATVAALVCAASYGAMLVLIVILIVDVLGG